MEEIVTKIIEGSISKEEISDLLKKDMLFKKYEGKYIIDYILEYKRNTNELDQIASLNIYLIERYIYHRKYKIIINMSCGFKQIIKILPDINKIFYSFLIDENISYDDLIIIINQYKNNKLNYQIDLNNEVFKNNTNLYERLYEIIKKYHSYDLIFYFKNYYKILLHENSNGESLIKEILNNKISFPWKRISNKELIKKHEDTCILYKIIEYDSDLALNLTKDNPFFTDDIRKVLELKSLGIVIPLTCPETFLQDIYIDTMNIVDEKKNQEECPIPEEIKTILQEFIEIMTQDGKSDLSIINLSKNALINAYYNGYPVLKEIKALIRIKKRFSDFSMVESQLESCFFADLNQLRICHKNSFFVLNHELTHVIHYYNDIYITPHDIKEKLKNIPRKKDKQILSTVKLIYEYMQTMEIDEKIYNICFDNAYQKYRQYCFSKLKDLVCKEDLDEIFTSLYDKKEFEEEISDTIIKGIFTSYHHDLIEMEDIFDATNYGKYFNNHHNNYFLKGHDLEYYKVTEPFIEIIADYVAIKKSSNNKKTIVFLTSILGKELIELFDEYLESLYEFKSKKLKK